MECGDEIGVDYERNTKVDCLNFRKDRESRGRRRLAVVFSAAWSSQ
jgi:hypothetical protein